ncbi:hypothetical protein GCM10027020_14260 [Nocardioides salsibiostraticola]
MRTLHTTTLRCIVALYLGLCAGLSSQDRDERGDVPGWVMITVMSAGLVGVIGTVASDQLGDMLRAALNSVK